MFSAWYALSSFIKQINFIFIGLKEKYIAKRNLFVKRKSRNTLFKKLRKTMSINPLHFQLRIITKQIQNTSLHVNRHRLFPLVWTFQNMYWYRPQTGVLGL